MKTQSLKLFAAILVIGTFAVVSAFAQQTLSFEIPFDFQVGKTELDAGKYEMRKLDSAKYILRNAETGKSMIVVTLSETGDSTTAKTENLVFARYGENYFLREIYAHRGTFGRDVGETKAERKIRKEYKNNPKLAKKDAKPEQVSINSTQ